MREILFRGKRLDNGEWVEGSLHIECGETRQDGTKTLDYRILGMRGECYYIDPDTVGQFTGMLDKNGKRIFEGDIVQGKDRLEKHLEVFGYIDHQNGSFVITCDFMTHYRWLDYEVEVIGNIHDNPELLEG